MSTLLEHKHLIVRGRLNKPPQNDIKYIKKWLKKLVKDIGMKVLKGPIAVYSDMEGNRGLTAVTIIETSHIAMHIWDEVQPALIQFDVYSCASFDPQIIFDALSCFEPVEGVYYFLDRDYNSSEIKIIETSKVKETEVG